MDVLNIHVLVYKLKTHKDWKEIREQARRDLEFRLDRAEKMAAYKDEQ